MKKAKQNSNPRKEVFEELFSLHRKGELSLLEEKLNIEIKKFPTSSRLYNLMGACLAKQNNLLFVIRGTSILVTVGHYVVSIDQMK